MADIPQELATLLGRPCAVSIRRTDERPPRLSAIDVSVLVTNKDARKTAQDIGYVKERFPEVARNLGLYKFPGRRQRETPVVNVRGAIELVLLLPGRHAARVRREAASLLTRYLGGDLALVQEICRNRGLQEELAVRRPNDPRRIFGETVELASASSGAAGAGLSHLFSALQERLSAQINERFTAHAREHAEAFARIQERLDEDRARVNLNVRAPKRAAPHQPQITRDLLGAGRPFPVSRYLDEKEREDPTWAAARRSFAPAFSMTVQVLKKKKLREEGKAAVYVEQNHRPQLMYTEEDRDVMQEAWQLAAAHREDLAGRPGNPQSAPAVLDRPTVLDMLRGA